MKISLIKTADNFTETSIYSSQQNGKGVLTRQHYGEHLGLGYVASALKQGGHKVSLMYQLEDINNFTRRIYDLSPDVVMATSLTGAFNNTKTIFRNLKDLNSEIITVVGGDHISGHPKSVDDVAVDFGIIGEGEDTSLDLIKSIESRADPRKVRGIVYKDSDQGVIVNSPAEPITSLNNLSFPLRTQESISQTGFSAIFDPSPSKSLPMGIFYSSRGCPYKCKECSSKNTLGVGVRYRSIDNVIEEIKEVKKTFGIKAMTFYDLTFNANRKHIEDLCYGLIEAGIGLNWYAMARITSPSGKPMLDKDILGLMHEAGCRKVSFGIESFDQDVLDYYGKKADLEQIRETLEQTDRAGMINRVFLMLGNKDSSGSIKRTLEGLMTCPIHEIRISILTPFPGTKFYDECQEREDLITSDWTKYTGDYSILKPNHFSRPSDLIVERERMFREFMNSPIYQQRMKEKIRRNPEFAEGVKEYFNFLKNKKIIQN